jgi:tripartite-type tricarboxylate transporter receptor subunit TctC
MGQVLSERLGQSFLVENRPGANGIIGINHVAKSAPDGYTLLVYPSLMVITPMLLKNIPYDAMADFTPISLLGTVPLVIVVHPSVQAGSLREFLSLARANPDKIAFGASSIGSVGHLTTERLGQEAGLKILLVPYKGAAPAVTDLIAGRIAAMIDPIPVFIEHIRAGELRPLGVTTQERVATMPEVPTLTESGLTGFEERSWYGIWGPARMPREVVNLLNREIAEAMKSPRVGERLAAQGMAPLVSKPEDFASFINAEVVKYSRLIKDANIRLED